MQLHTAKSNNCTNSFSKLAENNNWTMERPKHAMKSVENWCTCLDLRNSVKYSTGNKCYKYIYNNLRVMTDKWIRHWKINLHNLADLNAKYEHLKHNSAAKYSLSYRLLLSKFWIFKTKLNEFKILNHWQTFLQLHFAINS